MIYFSDVQLLESWDDGTDFNYYQLLSSTVNIILLFQALDNIGIIRKEIIRGYLSYLADLAAP